MTNAELNNLTLTELRELNSRVVKMMKLKQQIEGAINLDNLEVGMQVEYIGGTNKIKGETFIIEKINKVNVICKSEVTGKRWNIKPSGLRQYKEIDLDLAQHLRKAK
jgi:hypothetical protein